MLLNMAVENPKMRGFMEKQGIAEEDMDNITMLMATMIAKAQTGNVGAAEFVRDTTGQDFGTNEDLKLRKEDLKLRKEELELKKEAIEGTGEEPQDDGFIDALKGCAAEDWEDGDDEPPEE